MAKLITSKVTLIMDSILWVRFDSGNVFDFSIFLHREFCFCVCCCCIEQSVAGDEYSFLVKNLFVFFFQQFFACVCVLIFFGDREVGEEGALLNCCDIHCGYRRYCLTKEDSSGVQWW